MSGQTKTDDFLAMNPNGKVPVVKLPKGGIPPGSCPAVRAWLQRVESQDGFVPMVPAI